MELVAVVEYSDGQLVGVEAAGGVAAPWSGLLNTPRQALWRQNQSIMSSLTGSGREFFGQGGDDVVGEALVGGQRSRRSLCRGRSPSRAAW